MSQYALNYNEKKIVGLAALGGMLEFYDFIIYGVFSVYFAEQFFPSNSELISIIESYVVFVLGYVARPIGGAIFSHVGDEYGRKKVLITTVILMGASSIGIGILPTYEQIGVAAPIALLALRLMQGVAVGGELPSTYVYVSESMPSKRGSGIGLTMVGVNGGLLLGMFANWLLNTVYTHAQLSEFAWRIPFIFGGALCIVSFYVRRSLEETRAFQTLEKKTKFPLGDLIQTYPRAMLAGIAITGLMSGLVVAGIIFMPTYLTNILKIDSHEVSMIMPIAMACNLLTIYVVGIIANRVGVFYILRVLLAICVFLIPTSYLLIQNGVIMLGVCIIAALEGAAAMLIPLSVTSLFPTKIRLTGVAMCYNIGFTIFGGLAPIIISFAVSVGFGVAISPVAYLIAVVAISVIGVYYANRITLHTNESRCSAI